MRRLFAATLLSCCATLTLPGCVQQDPTSPFTPDDVIIPADTTAPTVTQTAPFNGAAGVSADAPIIVSFSEPMNQGQGTLRLTVNGQERTETVNRWTDSRSFRVSPFASMGLPSGAQVQVTLETDFQDVAGNRLAAPVVFSFTVGRIDTGKPYVMSSTPSEHQEDVDLGLTQVAIRFNENLRPQRGTVTALGGLTVGTPTWAQDTVWVPVSGLAPDHNYALRLSGFEDLAGNTLDGAPYLIDGLLNFSTGKDTVRPIVLSSSPAEGASGVDPGAVPSLRLGFSKPIHAGCSGTLVEGGSRTPLPAPVIDGASVTFNLPARLRQNATWRLELQGCNDTRGNALDGGPVLGDGALDFSTGTDTTRPVLTVTSPEETPPVPPVKMHKVDEDTVGLRQRFLFEFSEVMDTAVATVTLHDRTHAEVPPRTLTGTWAASGKSLLITVEPPAEGQPPLAGETRYSLDLSGLRDGVGNPLAPAPGLAGGDLSLDFTTAPRQPDLEHACTHALLDTPVPLQMTTPPRSFTLETDHTHYEYLVPEDTSRWQVFMFLDPAQQDRDQPVALYFDRPVLFTSVRDVTAGNAVLPHTLQRMASPCVDASQSSDPSVLHFTAPAGHRVQLDFSTHPVSFRFVLERY